MASNTTMKFKVHFKNGELTEIRRFNLDLDQADSLFLLKEKLQLVFPVLRTALYKMYWKDSDDDKILIATNEDLHTVYAENADVNSLYINVLDNKDDTDDEIEVVLQTPYPVVYCDSCNNIITGFRYKCMECPDYDLCGKCENMGLHSEHFMLRALCNSTMPRHGRRFMSHFHRSMRRSGREGHRFGRHGEKCKEKKSAPEEGASRPRCPYAEGGIDLREMARQGLPFLEALRSNPTLNETLKSLHEIVADFLKPVQTPAEGQNAEGKTAEEMEVVNESQGSAQPSAPAPEPTSSAPSQTQPINPKVAKALQQMKEMGFSDESGLFTDLLVHHDGDVEKVIRAVLENQS